MRKREPKLIVNAARRTVVCESCALADSISTRTRGLLGRDSLPGGDGVLLSPARSIHTAFMRFPIDVVFLDRERCVIKLVAEMDPWRTAQARRASAVLELAAGEIAKRGIELGDQLTVLSEAPTARVGTPTRVLLIAADRRFRSVASMLLARRGYSVLVRNGSEDIAEATMRERAEVVVIDASPLPTEAVRQATKLQALCPSVGVVAVSDHPEHERGPLPVLLKWGAFGALFDAIEQARADKQAAGVSTSRASWGATNGAH